MVLSGLGDLGLGVLSPEARLQIDPSSFGNSNAFFIGRSVSAGGFTGLGFGLSAASGGYAMVQAVKASGSDFGDLVLNPSGGNIGIGVTAPVASLDLRAGTVTRAPLKFNSGPLLTLPEDGVMEYLTNKLYFSLGSVRYQIPLTSTTGDYSNVSTIGNSTGNISINPNTGTGSLIVTGGVSTGTTSGALIVSGGVAVSQNINVAGAVSSASMYTPQIYGSSLASGNIHIDGTDHATKGNVLLASTGGRVGIGTSTPTRNLDITGAGAVFYNIETTTPTGTPSEASQSWTTPAGFAIQGLANSPMRGLNFTQAGDYYFNNRAGGRIALSTDTAFSRPDLVVAASGEVGIGTATPSNKLDVLGNIRVGGTVPNTLVVNSSTGNVGISGPAISGTSLALGADTGPSTFRMYNAAATALNRYTDFINTGSEFTVDINNNTGGVGTRGFRFANGATTLMKIQQNGHVGIGTSSPGGSPAYEKVSIQNNGIGANGTWLGFKNSSGTTRWHMGEGSTGDLNFSESGVADGRLYLKAGGNVGIGTTAPSTSLSIGNSILAASDFSTYVVGKHQINDVSTEVGSYTSSAILLQPSLATNATGPKFAQSLNVNVPITSTVNHAGLYGSYSVITHSGSGSAGAVKASLGTATLNGSGSATVTTGGEFIATTTGASSSTTLYGLKATALHDSSGTAPTTSYGLYGSSGANNGTTAGTLTNTYGVYARTACQGGLVTCTNRYSGYFTQQPGSNSSATNNYGVYIGGIQGATNVYDLYAADVTANNYFAGNVGMGITNPSYPLDVSGSIRATDYLFSSDRRIKKNIQTIPRALEAAKALRGVSFTWKNDGRPSIGFIAQEVEKHFPELVKTDATGMKSVQYGNITAILLEAMKEYFSKNDEDKEQLKLRLATAEKEGLTLKRRFEQQLKQTESEKQALHKQLLDMQKRLEQLERAPAQAARK
jgi:hypothetical protein